MADQIRDHVQKMQEAGVPEADILAWVNQYDATNEKPSGPFSLSSEEWGAMPAGQKMRNVLKVAGNLIGGGLFGQAGVEAVESPKMAVASIALPGAIRKLPQAVEPVRRAMGISRVRAGQTMQEVARAAQDVPVRSGGIGPTIERAKELQGTGSRMPRVVPQLSRRMAERPDGALDFREGSDFVSSLSRMSVNERNALNPQMHRQVVQVRDALRDALTESAETVGRGQQYAKGVKEYARAARVDEAIEALKEKLLPKILGAAGAGAAGGAVYHAFGGKKK